jgi:hypothetical protein
MRERRSRYKLGRRLLDGIHMRSVPQLEEDWNGTFNLRWLRHAEQKREGASLSRDAARTNRLGPAV